MCKICNYFIEFDNYDFKYKVSLTKSDKYANKKTYISHKRQRLEKYEELRKTLANIKDQGYFSFN